MFIDSLFRAAVVVIIPLLSAWNLLAIWHIYVVAAVYGALFMVPLAGGPTLVPRLVSKQHLATANALETLTFTLGAGAGNASALRTSRACSRLSGRGKGPDAGS